MSDQALYRYGAARPAPVAHANFSLARPALLLCFASHLITSPSRPPIDASAAPCFCLCAPPASRAVYLRARPPRPLPPAQTRRRSRFLRRASANKASAAIAPRFRAPGCSSVPLRAGQSPQPYSLGSPSGAHASASPPPSPCGAWGPPRRSSVRPRSSAASRPVSAEPRPPRATRAAPVALTTFCLAALACAVPAAPLARRPLYFPLWPLHAAPPVFYDAPRGRTPCPASPARARLARGLCSPLFWGIAPPPTPGSTTPLLPIRVRPSSHAP